MERYVLPVASQIDWHFNAALLSDSKYICDLAIIAPAVNSGRIRAHSETTG
jgi:hypothetical protein